MYIGDGILGTILVVALIVWVIRRVWNILRRVGAPGVLPVLIGRMCWLR